MSKYFDFVKWVFNVKNSDPFNVAIVSLTAISVLVMSLTEIQYGLILQVAGFALLLIAQLVGSLHRQYQRELEKK